MGVVRRGGVQRVVPSPDHASLSPSLEVSSAPSVDSLAAHARQAAVVQAGGCHVEGAGSLRPIGAERGSCDQSHGPSPLPPGGSCQQQRHGGTARGAGVSSTAATMSRHTTSHKAGAAMPSSAGPALISRMQACSVLQGGLCVWVGATATWSGASRFGTGAPEGASDGPACRLSAVWPASPSSQRAAVQAPLGGGPSAHTRQPSSAPSGLTPRGEAPATGGAAARHMSTASTPNT
jgi:hypothetical protein